VTITVRWYEYRFWDTVRRELAVRVPEGVSPDDAATEVAARVGGGRVRDVQWVPGVRYGWV
jgi:hypothetical protein